LHEVTKRSVWVIPNPSNAKPATAVGPFEQPSAFQLRRAGFSAHRRRKRAWETHSRALGKLSQARCISHLIPNAGLSTQGTNLGQPPQEWIVSGKPADLDDGCTLARFQNVIGILGSADEKVLVTCLLGIEVTEHVKPGHTQSGSLCRLCCRANRGSDQNDPLLFPAPGAALRQFLI